MLPSVIVWRGKDRREVYEHLDVDESHLLAFEGGMATVDEFRHWVNSTMEILKSGQKYSGLIWDAHLLSWDCQAVLLKPLEEIEIGKFTLITDAENLLTETILSRCEIRRLDDTINGDNEDYWVRTLRCWKEGPSACIALSDELKQDEVLELSVVVIRKLRELLRGRANSKRVEMLRCAMVLAEEMRAKNLNIKLCLGEFLFNGWRMAKNLPDGR